MKSEDLIDILRLIVIHFDNGDPVEKEAVRKAINEILEDKPITVRDLDSTTNLYLSNWKKGGK